MRRTALLVASLLAAAPLLAPFAGARAVPQSPPDAPVERLSAYLTLDTTNPPGNEHLAARFLREALHREGVATRLLLSPTGRPNLYARLESGAEDRGALVLLHHMDVVPAGPGWDSDPFAPEERDGRLYGRGAVDVKSLGIAHLEAFLELHRSGVALTRDVVFLAVADEETGGGEGAGWLLERYPEMFEGAAAVLGEGGNNRVYQGRLIWWGVEVSQKRPLWLRVVARGRGGHGSTLNLHTAPHRLVRALARLADREPVFRVSPPVRAYFEAVAEHQGPGFRELVDELDDIVASPDARTRLLPGLPGYLVDSVQINRLRAGDRVNVTPEEAEALVDVRLLPDTDGDAFLAELHELLGDEVEVEILLSAPPAEPAPTDTELFGCIADYLESTGPVVPTFIAGVTDSRYFRERSIPAYGFSPFVLDSADLRGIHGPNEKIPLDAFVDGVATTVELVRACATEAD